MKKSLIILSLVFIFGTFLHNIYLARSAYISNSNDKKNIVLVGIDEYAKINETFSSDEVKNYIALADGKEMAMNAINALTLIAISNTLILFFGLVYLTLSGRIFNKSRGADASGTHS